MKLGQIILFSLLLTVPAMAQITITSSDMEQWYAVGNGRAEFSKDGDTTKYVMNVGIASTTQGQSWTLPTVEYADTMLYRNILPASTPYGDQFPLATHAETVEMSFLDVTYNYYQYMALTPDSLVTLGTAMRQRVGNTIDTSMVSLSRGITIPLPAGVGLVLPEVIDTFFQDAANYEAQRARQTIDAYGTIVLPNGTFPCLRIKRVSHYDKYRNGVVDTFTLVRYRWLTKEGHEAVVSAAKNDEISGTINVEEVRLTKVVAIPTGVFDPVRSAPEGFVLAQNYPNPFNPSTTIRFDLRAGGHVRLAVYNLLGEEVAILIDGDRPSGPQTIVFDASGLSSGTYLYRLSSPDGIRVGRMNLLK